MKRKEYWNQKEMSYWEKLYYLEIARGLWVTFSVFIKNLYKWCTGKKGALTVYYPEERRSDYASNFRGKHKLTILENGRPKCIACKMCENICPSKSIKIVAGKSPDEKDSYSLKIPLSFDLDYASCIFCGHCVEICPKDAIIMTNDVSELPTYAREKLLYSLSDLLESKKDA
ncbi:MAG: NADH-quinone oxidoreductase subunit I [Oligoflexia bacterium]|nr:NADH-quinone oxidoreductase subunit I [Oligoflexia bacterium]MBF0366268.1 NADH-quinone oxidoreductase subunit I [Oligoflexia bacterium]